MVSCCDPWWYGARYETSCSRGEEKQSFLTVWLARVIYLLLNDFPLHIHQEAFDITELSTTVTATLIYHWVKAEDAKKKSKAVQSMIRLMMTSFTWKLRVCFVKDVRRGGKPTTFWIRTSDVNTHRGTFRSCILSHGNVHPHCNDRNKSVLRRLFLEVLTSSCCLGFAGKKGVELVPLAYLEALSNHLAFYGKCNTQIQKHDSQNCTSEPWFRETEVNQKSSALFAMDPDNCPVI